MRLSLLEKTFLAGALLLGAALPYSASAESPSPHYNPCTPVRTGLRIAGEALEDTAGTIDDFAEANAQAAQRTAERWTDNFRRNEGCFDDPDPLRARRLQNRHYTPRQFVEILDREGKFDTLVEEITFCTKTRYAPQLKRNFRMLSPEDRNLLANVFVSPETVFYYQLTGEQRKEFTNSYSGLAENLTPEGIRNANAYYSKLLGYDIDFADLDFADELAVFLFDTKFRHIWYPHN
jgi:hypothetical protein